MRSEINPATRLPHRNPSDRSRIRRRGSSPKLISSAHPFGTSPGRRHFPLWVPGLLVAPMARHHLSNVIDIVSRVDGELREARERKVVTESRAEFGRVGGHARVIVKVVLLRSRHGNLFHFVLSSLAGNLPHDSHAYMHTSVHARACCNL